MTPDASRKHVPPAAIPYQYFHFPESLLSFSAEMAHHALGAADFYTLVLGEVQSLVAVMRLNRKWKTPVRESVVFFGGFDLYVPPLRISTGIVFFCSSSHCPLPHAPVSATTHTHHHHHPAGNAHQALASAGVASTPMRLLQSLEDLRRSLTTKPSMCSHVCVCVFFRVDHVFTEYVLDPRIVFGFILYRVLCFFGRICPFIPIFLVDLYLWAAPSPQTQMCGRRRTHQRSNPSTATASPRRSHR